MTAQEEKYIKMTQTDVKRLVVSYAVPSIACMLISSIYNLADTFFVGKINTQSTAALGVVFPFMALIQAGSFYFGHGSGNYISRELGARNVSGASRMATTGLFSAIALISAIAALCFIFARPVLGLLGSTPTILPYAVPYFRCILLGAPFVCGSFVLNNQMRFQGNASLSMIGIMSGAILNILLDPIFIFVLGLGVKGAGLATTISQFTGFCLLLKLSFKGGGVGIHPKDFKLNFSTIKEINAGGLPSLCRQGLMAITGICLNLCARRFGDSCVAAFSIVGRVMSFAVAALIGFGQGFQPVCGFNFGARLFERVKKAFNFSLSVTTAYCILVAAVGFLFAESIITAFRATDAEVITIGMRALRWQCASFPLIATVIMTNMYLQTTRQTAAAVFVALARQGVFFLPALFLGTFLIGLPGLCAAQAIADVCSFAVALPLVTSKIKASLRQNGV